MRIIKYHEYTSFYKINMKKSIKFERNESFKNKLQKRVYCEVIISAITYIYICVCVNIFSLLYYICYFIEELCIVLLL